MTATSWEDVVLREIDERGEGLTRWELDFVESIQRQREQGRELSEKQAAMLGEIHDRRVSQ